MSTKHLVMFLNVYTVPYTGKYAPLFYFHTFRLRCQQANLRSGKLQCFKLSIFKHKYVWENLRWKETVCKCRRANITHGENNPVCSICENLLFFLLFYRSLWLLWMKSYLPLLQSSEMTRTPKLTLSVPTTM